ncbi:phosphate ABC transporter ATP-binding protein [Sesbania bispinosa]|nr:phosphate ABC transporter ATP-binding protein [Sesbania bispinosa]
METVGDVTGTHTNGPPAKTTQNVGLSSEQSAPFPTDVPQGNRPPPRPQTSGNPVGKANQTSMPTSSGTQSSLTSILADKWWCLFNNFTGPEGSNKEVAILHAQGFLKAIEQVKVLNPTVNVEGVGFFKKIVDGKLVEESEDEEE